jgi:Xaa-Pro aminopeptidase
MKNLLVFIVVIAFLSASFPVQLQAETVGKNDLKTIRVAPPAPQFTDSERQEELSRRRKKVLEMMADKSVMVLFSAESKIYSNDVDFMYRQENNLYYLTALKKEGATLVLTKRGGETREILFLPKRNPQFEVWNGRMYSNEDAARISGIKTIVDAAEQKNFLQALQEKKNFTSQNGVIIPPSFENLYLLLPESEFDRDGMREFRQEYEFSQKISGFNLRNAQEIFAELRLIKSPYEIKLIQHAIDITIEAQMRAMGMVKSATWEYEVQAEVEYTFRRRNADYWGYPSIVGCGPNATTLHYIESQGEIKPGDLLLMDVGAEYDHYTADVTRTFPVNGKFTKEQAEIYRIVYDAQEAAAAQIKPGARFFQASQAASQVIEAGLAKLGLIEKIGAKILQKVPDGKGGMREVEISQVRLWYMHGWGHWLGMNVHDVGDYGTVFKPGMIMTNEPGIYIREDALDYLDLSIPQNKAFVEKVKPVFEKYKNIGVRIEDNMLVTSNGTEWLTRNLPRKLEEVEDFMAKASKEMQAVSRNTPQNSLNLAIYDFNQNLMQIYFSNPFFWRDHAPTSGQTLRRGWLRSGKNTAYSSLYHSH